MRGFALSDAEPPSAHQGTTHAPGSVACAPPFLATVMTGAAVGMFAGYALGAPRWASWTAGIGAALFLVPVRTLPPPQPQQGA